MNRDNLISTQILCTHYNIEVSFVDELYQMGLIQMQIVEQTPYIHEDHVADLEKIIRLHQELNVNLEGIDIVLNLLEHEADLRRELTQLKNRLRLYEG